MANEASTCILFLSFLIFFCSGTNAFSTISGARFLPKSKISKSQIQFLVTDHKIWRKLLDTNPSPTIITVPSTNPVTTVSPTNPGATPVTVPSTTPPAVPLSPTNPANSPVPVTPPTVPGGTTPVNSYPPPSPLSGGTGTVPVANPPPSSTSPPSSSSGGSWCVAKPGTPQSTLQTALDYACGTKGTDCSQINQGGSCYNPNSLQNHASFAFNSYYVKNPAATSCDFGGVATITSTNPSSGTCIFPSASGGGAGTGTGTGTGTSGGSGTTSSPVGFGPQSSPLDSSHSTGLRPLLSCMVLVTLLVSGRLGMSP